MSEGGSAREGSVTTLTKQLSEADVALFELVTSETQVTTEETPIPARQTRQIVPTPLVGALLAVTAARHSMHPGLARFTSQQVTFHEAAYTDEPLTVTAQVVAQDAATRSLRIQVRCESQEGRKLAEGEFVLSDA